MNIGFIAAGSRKDLIENFCVAYKSILARHELYATEMTGRRIELATNLKVHKDHERMRPVQHSDRYEHCNCRGYGSGTGTGQFPVESSCPGGKLN